MLYDFLRRLTVMVVLCLAQALVLNRIQLFHCATPLLYAYFAIIFPRSYPKWAILIWAFLLGLLIDTFSNTPGLAAASLTLIAAIQPYIFELFVPRDSAENLKPALSTLGPTKYSYYIILLVLLYCLVFYSLELFNFFNWQQWAMCIGGSAVITLVLIYTFEIAKAKRG